MFAFMGGDIVAVTAGEAKDPCRDIPPAARYMYKLPVVLYLLSSFLVGFNINYLEPQLWQLHQRKDDTVMMLSPFIIAAQHAGFPVLPGLINAGIIFSAHTAA